MNKNRNRYTGEGGICGWGEKAVLAKEGQLYLGKRGGYAGEGGEGGLLGRRECSPREEGKILTGEGGVSTGEGGTAFLKREGRYHRGRKGSCARDGSPAGTRDSCIEERETTASRKGQQL